MVVHTHHKDISDPCCYSDAAIAFFDGSLEDLQAAHKKGPIAEVLANQDLYYPRKKLQKRESCTECLGIGEVSCCGTPSCDDSRPCEACEE